MNVKPLSAVALFATMMMSWFVSADTEVVDGIEWTYTINNGEATIENKSVGGCGIPTVEYSPAVPTSTSGQITIPSTLGKCPVVHIGNSAFAWCEELSGIEIPSSVKSIGDWAFNGCRGIENITIPAAVESIGRGAFFGCDSYMQISVEKENQHYKTFNWCLMTKDGTTLLRGINCDLSMPLSVTNIADYAFYNCDAVTSIEIPPNVASIGEMAFYGCCWMEELTMPEGLKEIGYGAFSTCTSLTCVNIPSSVKVIGEEAFYECQGLTDVTISEGVEMVGLNAFAYCAELTSVTIPSSVKKICRHAFAACTSMTNVLLCGAMPRIDADAFRSNEDSYLDSPNLTLHTTANPLSCAYVAGVPLVFDNYNGQFSETKTTVLVVTNVIIHYVQTSGMSSMAAPVTKDVGIVNVMTEIQGGNISIPGSWVTNYPAFKETFGSNFAEALIAETGKFDAGGKPMYVWQDYVAGTDPTDKDSVFRASVTMVGGKPVISYTPELSAAEKAKRQYTTLGKVRLQDDDWAVVPPGNEADYNFFKVRVEMRGVSK